MSTTEKPLPRGRILATACAGMIILAFTANIAAFCLISIAGEFALDNTRSGFLLSCAFIGLLPGLLAAGPLADRFGFRPLMVSAAVLETAGLLTASWAPTATVLYAGAGLSGMGMGLFDALSTPLVCAGYVRFRTRVANLLHGFYPFGILLLAALVYLLTEVGGWNWRGVYRLAGLAPLPVGLVFLFLPLPAHSHEGPHRQRARRLVTLPSFIVPLAVIALAGMAELGPSQWLPAYVVKATGGSRGAGTLGLALLGMVMALGRFGNSYLANHFHPRQLLIMGAAVAGSGLVLASLPLPTPWVIAFFCLMGLGVAGLWPTTLALSANRFPSAGASMYSVLHASGTLGGLVGPIFIGIVSAGLGLSGGIAILAVAPTLIVVLLLAADRRWS